MSASARLAASILRLSPWVTTSRISTATRQQLASARASTFVRWKWSKISSPSDAPANTIGSMISRRALTAATGSGDAGVQAP